MHSPISPRGLRIRFVRQATLADCGLACVAMIASAYGCNISLFELSKRFAPGLRGTFVFQVLTIARALGFDADAVAVCLHRTTGIDFLHWIASRLQTHEFLTENIPTRDEDLPSYGARVRDAFATYDFRIGGTDVS